MYWLYVLVVCTNFVYWLNELEVYTSNMYYIVACISYMY